MLRRIIGGSIAAAILSIAATPAFAIPAKPGIQTIVQADGSTVEARLIGDEYGHIYLGIDGKPLITSNGMLYYADVMPDGELRCSAKRYTGSDISEAQPADIEMLGKAIELRRKASPMLRRQASRLKTQASRAAEGSALPGLFPGSDYPVTGKPKAVVILVEYSDVKMSVENPHDYFHRMLTEQGFKDFGGTGSALDYFSENSGGLFEPQFDLYGPVTLPETQKYYGGNNSYGDDLRPEQMIIDACRLLDDEIDFAQYDTNGDGRIDNVFVFYAGMGEASGGGPNTVWPHSYNVSYVGNHFFDGVQLDRYACTNEWTGKRPDGVGTFIHEFSHVMGLPDLYSTSYTSSFTPGEWSALDYGPYNNDGCTPPYYSAFERAALGWLQPTEIKKAVNATLPPISENKAGIVRTDSPNEFFLFENRQKTGWDAYIPGHGMLVWHVEYDPNVWNLNTVNNRPSHQYVDIEEADGTQTELSRAGDAFPGTRGIRSFTDDTKPSMRTAAGTALGIPLTEISEANGLITFKACGGRDALQPPTALEASSTSSDAFTARWQSTPEASYYISVYTKDATCAPSYLPGYRLHYVGSSSSAVITGLEPLTTYHYTVHTGDEWEISSPSNEISVKTGLSALENLVETSAECRIATDGLSITVAKCPGTAVLYDLAGRVAATAREGETMYAPTPGTYILSAGPKPIKLFLK